MKYFENKQLEYMLVNSLWQFSETVSFTPTSPYLVQSETLTPDTWGRGHYESQSSYKAKINQLKVQERVLD